MYEARREPRPEFADRLRAKLDRQPARSPGRRLAPRPGLAVAAAAAVLVVGALIAFPSVRASAQAFLDLFRVRNFAAVQYDPARLEKLRALSRDDALLVFDRQEVIRDPGPPRAYPTPQAAGAAAGLELLQPGFLPAGLMLDTVLVQGPGEARFTASERKLRSLLDALDLGDVRIPAGLEGQSITVRKPPLVIERYRHGSVTLGLVQARSPEVALPAGLDLARLGEIGLRILGLDAGEARRLAQSIDWHSTLVVPVPLDASSFRRVTVQGHPGLLVRTRAGNDGAHRREGTVLMWSGDDRVFGLMSSLGGPDLVQVAESLR